MKDENNMDVMALDLDRRALLLKAASAALLAASTGLHASYALAAAATEVKLFKRTSLVRRRFDMTHEQFVAHWQNVHGPLEGRTVGLLRYVLNMVDMKRQPNSPFDGVAQVWYPTAEAAAFARKDPANAEIMALAGPDILKFLTPPFVPLVTKEFVVTPLEAKGPAPRTNHIVLLKSNAKLSLDQFQDYWLNTHAQTASKLPGLRQQKVNITDRENTPTAPWDGYAEYWFDSQAAKDVAFRPNGQIREAMGKELSYFTNVDATVSLITSEVVIK